MTAAIMDGTLEPGERLNDDDLVTWLGVSRTPIREAIAKLVSYGLVEMEANRWTRISIVTDEAYKEASAFLTRLQDLGTNWGIPKLDAAAKKRLAKTVKATSQKIEKHDVSGVLDLLDNFGEVATASDNALFVGAEEPLRIRVKFLSPKEPDAYNWVEIQKRADGLLSKLS